MNSYKMKMLLRIFAPTGDKLLRQLHTCYVLRNKSQTETKMLQPKQIYGRELVFHPFLPNLLSPQFSLCFSGKGAKRLPIVSLLPQMYRSHFRGLNTHVHFFPNLINVYYFLQQITIFHTFSRYLLREESNKKGIICTQVKTKELNGLVKMLVYPTTMCIGYILSSKA